jgi:hypothetical protein
VDEYSMAHKKALEALDRKDIRGNNRPMGGAVTVLAGDFRHTLPDQHYILPSQIIIFFI